MSFCILIELSKKEISFLYNRSDGESRFAPFVGEGCALPLAIYCLGNDIQIGQFAIDEAMRQSPHVYTDVFQTMKTVGMYKYRGNEYHYNTLLKNAIEKYLSKFFDEVLIGQYGRLEQNIASMPLCFVFNSDVDENERLFVRDCFVNGGYGNLATIDYDQLVVEALDCASNHAVCVTSDGKDLNMSLYETKTHTYLGGIVMPNRGEDPRVETAVNKLWDSLGFVNYYLNLDSERSVLTKVAENFLSSGDHELQEGILFSDGKTRECFLSMGELNDYRYNDDGRIVQELKCLLQRQNINPLDCAIVLKDKAANNDYFRHIFNGEFNSLLNLDSSFRTRVYSQLLNDIRNADYRFASVESQQPSIKKTDMPDQSAPINPSGLLKRDVRTKIAEIKGKIRIRSFAQARTLATALLNDLHQQGFSNWDGEINSVMREIPIGGTNDSPKQEVQAPKSQKVSVPEQKKEDPQKYQREVRIQIAEAKAKIRKGDNDAAATVLLSLKARLNAKGVSFYNKDLDELLNGISQSANRELAEKKPKRANAGKEMSEAERLLTAGNFSEAKRAFATEGNSKMAQVCGELIKSKRTIALYQSGLESAKHVSNRSTISAAIRVLSKLLEIYRTHHIDTSALETLINNYKSIK